MTLDFAHFSSQLPFLLLALGAGAAAGFVFFQGLWLTVKRLPASRNPGLLLMASLAIRMALAVGIIYAATLADPLRVVAALAGFLALRALLTRLHGAKQAESKEAEP